MGKIEYVLGQGREVKAEYQLGSATVPAGTVTRMLNALTGKTGSALTRAFYQGFVKYSEFLDALDKENISPVEALAELQALRPVKVQVVRQRASTAAKAAETFAKGICKRFSGDTPAELIKAFRLMVMDEDFSKELTSQLASYLGEYGTSNGHIKTSNRKANPKALAALAKARGEKKQSVPKKKTTTIRSLGNVHK